MKGAMLGLILCLGLMSLPAAAKTYSWVDKDGNRHFSQTPPPGQETEQQESVAETAPAQPEQKKESRRSRLKAARERARKRSPSNSEANSAWAESAQHDRERCDEARQTLREYTGNAGQVDEETIQDARNNVHAACD